jgi:hypothetical protein
MLNFEEVKKVRLTDIAGRYGIKLRFKGAWASAPCPLPTHKAGDKGRSFTINLQQNYWRCFSESCNESNGGKKGGDVINFVALMENCRERDAAQNLADWYGLSRSLTPEQKESNNGPNSHNGQSSNSLTKTAQHIAGRPRESSKEPSAMDSPDNTSPAVAGKSGYIHALDDWFNTLFELGPELVNDESWKKRRNAVKAKCIESFRNGKLAANS